MPSYGLKRICSLKRTALLDYRCSIFIHILHLDRFTLVGSTEQINTVVKGPECSALLMPESTTGHKPEIVPTPILTTCVHKIYCNVILPFLSWHFSRGFPTKILCAFPIAPILATCPAHLSLLEITVLTRLCGLYKSQYSLLCNMLNCWHISYSLGLNILLSTMFWDACNLCFSGE